MKSASDSAHVCSANSAHSGTHVCSATHKSPIKPTKPATPAKTTPKPKGCSGCTK